MNIRVFLQNADGSEISYEEALEEARAAARTDRQLARFLIERYPGTPITRDLGDGLELVLGHGRAVARFSDPALGGYQSVRPLTWWLAKPERAEQVARRAAFGWRCDYRRAQSAEAQAKPRSRTDEPPWGYSTDEMMQQVYSDLDGRLPRRVLVWLSVNGWTLAECTADAQTWTKGSAEVLLPTRQLRDTRLRLHQAFNTLARVSGKSVRQILWVMGAGRVELPQEAPPEPVLYAVFSFCFERDWTLQSVYATLNEARQFETEEIFTTEYVIRRLSPGRVIDMLIAKHDHREANAPPTTLTWSAP